MKRITTLAAAAVALLALGACSSTDGGETTCEEFLGLDSEEQTSVVEDWADDELEDAEADVDATVQAVTAACEEDSDTPISDAAGLVESAIDTDDDDGDDDADTDDDQD